MFGVGDSIVITDGVDAGRHGVVTAVNGDDVKAKCSEGNWNCMFGLDSEYEFDASRVRLVRPNLKVNDRIVVLDVTFDGKKNINTKAKAGMKGKVLEVLKYKAKVLLDSGVECSVGLKLLSREGLAKKSKIVDFKTGDCVNFIKDDETYRGLVTEMFGRFVIIDSEVGIVEVSKSSIKSKIKFKYILKQLKLEKSKHSRKQLENYFNDLSILDKINDRDIAQEVKRKIRDNIRYNTPTNNKSYTFINKKYNVSRNLGKLDLRNSATRDMIKKKYLQFLKDMRAQKNNQGIELVQRGGRNFSKVGKVYTKPNQIKSWFDARCIDLIRQTKKPILDNANYVGIEIECFTNLSRSELDNKLVEAKLQSNVQLVSDGSLRNGRGEPIEIRVLATENRIEDVIRRLYTVLHAHDFNVNTTCGLHVHLDMRNRDERKCFKSLFNCQDLLFKAVDSSRVGNEYCRKVPESFEDTQRLGHYAAISTKAYSKHQTIELRMHEGTTDVDKVVNWYKMLIAIADTSITSPISTHQQLFEKLISVPEEDKNKFAERFAS